MKPLLRNLSMLLLVFSAAAAEPRVQSRSMVLTSGGIVACEHPLAGQAAAQVLADGGTAIDAAIAANALLGVVTPGMCGIGGDLFAIVYEAKTGRLHGLNASGWAPQALTADFLRARGFTSMPQSGIHAATVPGAVAGWEKLLTKFGRKSMRQVLAPAIRAATQGVPVSELNAQYWKDSLTKLRTNLGAANVYLRDNESPKVGEIFKNPDLAWSYRQLARHGAKAFYDGAIANRVLAASAQLGGTMTSADLREFSAIWVEPISTTYRGWTVYEIPPNGQGIAALSMLNVMERFPIGEYGHNSTKTLHVMIEAKKLAYADMLRYVADPEFAKTPVRAMLAKDYAAQRAASISPEHASCDVSATDFPTGTDTTYLCVVDREGNMISLIQSNYSAYGTGITPPGCGFALHNRGGLFSLDPAHPNVLSGRKRPLHTIIPAFMEKGATRIAFGIMGGWNQSQAHAQFVSKIVDHGLNIQGALDSPRFTKHTFPGCDVQVEARVAPEVRAELTQRGHVLKVIDPYDQNVGGGQAVARDFSTGVNFGASDPRKDGAAIPEPIRTKGPGL